MNLYLMRHGLAVQRGSPGYDCDEERPLTPKGERKVRRVAEALVRMDVSFDVIFSSPLLRAQQTAELLSDEMEMKEKVKLTDHLTPGSGVKALVSFLQQLPGSPQAILLVGHEPDLGQLAASLLAGSERATIVFKKGGVAKLAVESLRPGRCAAMEWLLTSRQLEMMA